MKSLPMNLSSMKKIDGDKNHSKFQHKDGHIIIIAHGALPTLQRKQLEKMPMAEGGDVKGVHSPMHEYLPGNSKAGAEARQSQADKKDYPLTRSPRHMEESKELHKQKLSELQSMPKPKIQGLWEGESDVQAPEPTPEPDSDDQDTGLASAQESMRNAFHYEEGGPVAHRGNNPKLQQSLVRNPPPKGQLEVLNKYAEGTDNVSSDDNQQTPDQSSKHTININVGQPAPTQLGNIPPVQGLTPPSDLTNVNVPPAPSAQNVPMNPNQTVNFGQALQQQGKAEQGMANIQGQQAQANAPLEQKAAEVQQNYTNTVNALANQHIQEFDQFSKELPNIDPKHYMNSMSAPGKIGTALGIFLGSAAGAVNPGANPALDFVNKQIDRDINAQIQNKDNKKTIYSAYEKLYGDTQAAVDMTRGAMLSIIGHQANQIAQKFATPMAVQKANQINAIVGQGQAGLARSAAMDAITNTPGGAGKPIQSPNGAINATPGGGAGTQGNPNSQGTQVSNPNTQIAPDADAKIAALQYGNERQQADYEPAMKSLNAVKQAEANIQGLKSTYEDAAIRTEKGGIGGRVGRAFEPSTVGSIPGGASENGNMVTGLVNAIKEPIYKLASTENTRAIDQNRSDLKKYVANALAGTNLGSGDINKYVDDHMPEYGDSPVRMREKRDALIKYIQDNLESSRTLLKKYDALKSKK